ncbi:MAG: asparaginase [Gammaproteobacteria bacterium]|uniref:asparaginase n=1 Tax=Rhodoferax sp. TaxID=50421 RepID=UPI0017D97695|nr:asparaginase [Rhodoferax sp.]MBU3898874.1 asparaginase [Gammaproteobacteria bacterium]MBA3059495.1 asparaginase [Rhodoferax sp.]MBU3999065.1 asparaginase [Gammaproteobacteria bacterium]MBU4019350.1 asparaginase [Gammaproteobacteria bacterium]MBU4081914.1 asparaginase [Gammaproteobacteria bacterium]
MAEKFVQKIVVLATGGTIAGSAASVSDNIGYSAAQMGVRQLLDSVPGLDQVAAGRTLVAEQVAQIDSKDMSFAVWQQLALRVSHHLGQTDVSGIVITHGTDTLEETAYFLHAVLPAQQLAAKPVVLTCAMRPASSAAPDGPQNLRDAVAVASTLGAGGVVAVCAGKVHAAVDVQKVDTYRLDAFSSGDAGVVAYVEEGVVRLVRNWPLALVDKAQVAIDKIASLPHWPRVEIVMNYAGASGALVDALLAPGAVAGSPAAQARGVSPVRGLVVDGTGNGTIHQDMEAALRCAQALGVKVVRSSRCATGRVLATKSSEFAHSDGLSPVKARIALMLQLMHS